MKTIYNTAIGTIFVHNDGETGWEILLTPPSGREEDLQVLCTIYPAAFDEKSDMWKPNALQEIRQLVGTQVAGCFPTVILEDFGTVRCREVAKIHSACFENGAWIPEIQATLIDIFEKPDTLEIE